MATDLVSQSKGRRLAAESQARGGILDQYAAMRRKLRGEQGAAQPEIEKQLNKQRLTGAKGGASIIQGADARGDIETEKAAEEASLGLAEAGATQSLGEQEYGRILGSEQAARGVERGLKEYQTQSQFQRSQDLLNATQAERQRQGGLEFRKYVFNKEFDLNQRVDFLNSVVAMNEAGITKPSEAAEGGGLVKSMAMFFGRTPTEEELGLTKGQMDIVNAGWKTKERDFVRSNRRRYE